MPQHHDRLDEPLVLTVAGRHQVPPGRPAHTGLRPRRQAVQARQGPGQRIVHWRNSVATDTEQRPRAGRR